MLRWRGIIFPLCVSFINDDSTSQYGSSGKGKIKKKITKKPITMIFHPTVLMGSLCSTILPDSSPSRWPASSFLVLFICPEASLPCLSMRFMLDKQLKERAGTSKAGLLIR